MRQLACSEIKMISGGDSDLALLCGLTLIIAACTLPILLRPGYSTYEVITPLYDAYGNYTGYDRVDTYVVPYY